MTHAKTAALFLILLPAAAQAAGRGDIAVSTAPVAISTAPAALMPPKVPGHEKRQLESVTDLSKDLAETAAFIEKGQGYFRAYTKGTHNSAENQEFVKFLQDYETELANAKKEIEVLQTWLQTKSDLKD